MKVLYLFKFSDINEPYSTGYITEEKLNWNINKFKDFKRIIILNYI